MYTLALDICFDLRDHYSHANIARFLGGTNPSTLEKYPFFLLHESKEIVPFPFDTISTKYTVRSGHRPRRIFAI